MKPEFKIMGRYLNAFEEEIDSADSKEEAKRLLQEYTVAFSRNYTLWVTVQTFNFDGTPDDSFPLEIYEELFLNG